MSWLDDLFTGGGTWSGEDGEVAVGQTDDTLDGSAFLTWSASTGLKVGNDGTAHMLGVGVVTPDSIVDVGPGTATKPQLKLRQGATALTVAEDGAIEHYEDKLYAHTANADGDYAKRHRIDRSNGWHQFTRNMAVLFTPTRLFLYDGDYDAAPETEVLTLGRPIRILESGNAWQYMVVAATNYSTFSGTLDAADETTFTLDDTASEDEHKYNGCVAIVTSGVAAGSINGCLHYDSVTRVCDVLVAWSGATPEAGDSIELVRTWEIYGEAADNEADFIEYGDMSKLVQVDLFTFGNVGGAATLERHYLTTGERKVWYGPRASLVAAFTRCNLGPLATPCTHTITIEGTPVATPVNMVSSREVQLWLGNATGTTIQFGERYDIQIDATESGGGTAAAALSTRLLFVLQELGSVGGGLA